MTKAKKKTEEIIVDVQVRLYLEHEYIHLTPAEAANLHDQLTVLLNKDNAAWSADDTIVLVGKL